MNKQSLKESLSQIGTNITEIVFTGVEAKSMLDLSSEIHRKMLKICNELDKINFLIGEIDSFDFVQITESERLKIQLNGARKFCDYLRDHNPNLDMDDFCTLNADTYNSRVEVNIEYDEDRLESLIDDFIADSFRDFDSEIQDEIDGIGEIDN